MPKKKKPLSQTEASPHCGPSSGRRYRASANQINTQTRRLLTDYAHICSQLCYWSSAIDASDQSAFCKRQLSTYNTPSVQKKASDTLTQGKARVPVNTVSDWASLFEERILVPGCVRWTLLSPPEHAWHWVVEDWRATANDRETVLQKMLSSPAPGYQ